MWLLYSFRKKNAPHARVAPLTSNSPTYHSSMLHVPDNALLTIPPESIPPQAIVQPPPYVAPPKPDDRQKSQKYQEILKDSQPPNLRAYSEKEKQSIVQDRKQDIYDPCIQQYDNRRNILDQQQMSNYEYQQRACSNYQKVYMHNARNQQLCSPVGDVNQSQQFYTLPTRRPQREIEPPRSVTPDITRGLGRGSLSSMHMLAKQGQQKVTMENEQTGYGPHMDAGRRNLEQMEARSRFVQSQPQSIVDVRNRFATPLNLGALGYRFFASSPANDPLTKSPNADVLRNNPISPIGHCGYGNGFKSSTPTNHNHGRSAPTVAERLALNAGGGNNCSSPTPASSSSGRSTPIQTSSGRTTPTNLILSPTKSTMSNEELFAAIHKSKKRLNIRLNDDNENLSPYGSMNSLIKTQAGTRHSWSPESQKAPEIPTTVQSPTSRMDFKRLLLQQSVKANPMRLSAAEQLKLSRQQCQQQQQQQSSPSTHQSPLAKVLSPRSVWRFQTPRTDVLSSTIIEDTAAEEKAMKPSPENTSPISRLNSRRQLDLCSDLPSHLRIADHENDAANLKNDRFTAEKTSTNELNPAIKSLNQNRTQKLTTDAPTDLTQIAFLAKTAITGQNNTASLFQNDLTSSAIQYSLESKNQNPVSALESRRISNQLARAQFLASTPTSTNPSQNLYFSKRLRARSESPQHTVTHNVAPRSPSAPTLETAL